VLDPDGLAVESTKANNTARIDVAVQDSDFYITNRYFSPNGDGVQDTTRFFYRLGAEELVTVEVVDRRGQVVRRSPPVSVQASDFEWDGLDDLGRLARDGDYRLQVVRGAEVLGQALVSLDTNRSSLIEALGTQLELSSNLTCDVTYPGRPTMSGDEQWVYFAVSYDLLYPNGIYRASSLGGDLERISELLPWNDIVVAPDASHVAFAAIRLVGNVYEYGLWVANGDGTSPRALRPQTSYPSYRPLGFIEGDRTLLVARESAPTFELEAIPLDGSDARIILSASIYSVGGYALSPRGTHLLWTEYGGSGSALRLVDLRTGASLVLPWADHFVWSPDGARFAATDRSSESVVIYDEAGIVRKSISIPVDPIPEDLLPDSPFDFEGLELSFFRRPTWSGSGTELAIIADYYSYEVTFGRLFRIDAVSGEIETIGWTEPQFNEGEGDGEGESYHVYSWDGGSFVEKGVLHYGLHYQDQELDLPEAERDPSGELRIRIRQRGREAAHVDAVALRAGGLEVPPVGAVREADATDVLAEVRARDSEVLDLHEAALTLVFERVPPGPLRLVLRAREETLTGRNARPFVYPSASDRYFDVALHPSTPMRIDGKQTGEDDLGEPLFEERSRPGTGHPAARVSGYAKSDGENLYAALDFTVDNTQDGEKDWAALLVGSGESWREFRVTAQDSRWGIAGFTRTGGPLHHSITSSGFPERGRGCAGDVVGSDSGYARGDNRLGIPSSSRASGSLWAPNERALYQQLLRAGERGDLPRRRQPQGDRARQLRLSLRPALLALGTETPLPGYFRQPLRSLLAGRFLRLLLAVVSREPDGGPEGPAHLSGKRNPPRWNGGRPELLPLHSGVGSGIESGRLHSHPARAFPDRHRRLHDDLGTALDGKLLRPSHGVRSRGERADPDAESHLFRFSQYHRRLPDAGVHLSQRRRSPGRAPRSLSSPGAGAPRVPRGERGRRSLAHDPEGPRRRGGGVHPGVEWNR
jgi:hypothetical protein